uniref:Putative ovule protein n=1 Tax=Solanum chacoense TaxID=4108 RepID=A0A0V0HK12_SOLCH
MEEVEITFPNTLKSGINTREVKLFSPVPLPLPSPSFNQTLVEATKMFFYEVSSFITGIKKMQRVQK